jgi:hypothetical protein
MGQIQTAAATRSTTHQDIYRGQTTTVKVPGFQEVPNSRLAPIPKSNFVTTDGYVPSYLTHTRMPMLPNSSQLINPEMNEGRRSQVKITQNDGGEGIRTSEVRSSGYGGYQGGSRPQSYVLG